MLNLIDHIEFSYFVSTKTKEKDKDEIKISSRTEELFDDVNFVYFFSFAPRRPLLEGNVTKARLGKTLYTIYKKERK